MRITLRFAASEAEELSARAAVAGLRLSPYIRRQLLGSEHVSRETALVLAELGRVRELMTRLWSAASEGELEAHRVVEIANGIDGIETRVLVARAVRGRQ